MQSNAAQCFSNRIGLEGFTPNMLCRSFKGLIRYQVAYMLQIPQISCIFQENQLLAKHK